MKKYLFSTMLFFVLLVPFSICSNALQTHFDRLDERDYKKINVSDQTIGLAFLKKPTVFYTKSTSGTLEKSIKQQKKNSYLQVQKEINIGTKTYYQISSNYYILKTNNVVYKKASEDLQSYINNLKEKKAIKTIVQKAAQFQLQEQQVFYVADYLSKTVSYDYDTYRERKVTYESYQAYGALVNHLAVCQGYASAFQEIMDKLNITNQYVVSDRMNHAWNAVEIGGEWFHVDTTWNDPNQVNYILLNDKEISKDHYGWDKSDFKSSSPRFSTLRNHSYFTDSMYLYYLNDDGDIIRTNLEGKRENLYMHLGFDDSSDIYECYFSNGKMYLIVEEEELFNKYEVQPNKELRLIKSYTREEYYK